MNLLLKNFNMSSSPDKGRLGWVCEESQNCNLKLKIKNISSFLLNIFALRYFKPPSVPPYQGDDIKYANYNL
ncbi:MAG: hypothetical protein KAS78_05475 [Candidatus Pacebacteria bacterium]|nr:hypothetical protein [Candidatus Paceibacterota bacterium]